MTRPEGAWPFSVTPARHERSVASMAKPAFPHTPANKRAIFFQTPKKNERTRAHACPSACLSPANASPKRARTHTRAYTCSFALPRRHRDHHSPTLDLLHPTHTQPPRRTAKARVLLHYHHHRLCHSCHRRLYNYQPPPASSVPKQAQTSPTRAYLKHNASPTPAQLKHSQSKASHNGQAHTKTRARVHSPQRPLSHRRICHQEGPGLLAQFLVALRRHPPRCNPRHQENHQNSRERRALSVLLCSPLCPLQS